VEEVLILHQTTPTSKLKKLKRREQAINFSSSQPTIKRGKKEKKKMKFIPSSMILS
jgi:hypothetical protein